MNNISDKSDKESDNLYININDIKKIWNKNFIDLSSFSPALDLINWKDKPNSNIKLLGRLFNFFIFEFNKIILIGFNNSVSKSWYKIRSIHDLHIFIDYFHSLQNKESKIKDKQIRLYLKSKFNYKQIIKYFYSHEFIEKNIYSDSDKIIVKNTTLQDEILLIDKFLETITNDSIVTFTTKYSSSKIILKYKDSKYYLHIIYKPFNLVNRFKILNSDMPSDIDIVLLNLDITRTEDILENIIDINEEDIDILFDIAPKDKIITIMSDIIKQKPNLESYITKKISLIDMDLTINKMEKDGIFKAFENSIDILLKTIYERFNDSEYDQSDNMLELNKKVKDKILKIFESKIIS